MTNIFEGSGYDKVKIRALLKQAQDAYHQLITGTKAVKVERNGRKVEFTQTNIHSLRLYIGDLQSNLSVNDGRGRTPMGVSY